MRSLGARSATTRVVRTLGWVALLLLPATAVGAQPDSARSRHVIVVSIDGLRPDAIATFRLETLQRLMKEGSYSLRARTILPSKTLPSHASMLTGVTPAVHGVTFNRDLPDSGTVAVPTIFERAYAAGYRTAAFFGKAKFRHLDRDAAYDYRQAPTAHNDNWMATRTVPDAIRYMRHRRPHLLFVHIAEPDYAGHGAGWMSGFYGLAARRADDAVGRLVEAAGEVYGADGFTLIVTADHGGHERSHGTDDPRDVLIPWIAYGKGVVDHGLPAHVRTTDTAATVLWLLGIERPDTLEGVPVYAAFDTATPVAADAEP